MRRGVRVERFSWMCIQIVSRRDAFVEVREVNVRRSGRGLQESLREDGNVCLQIIIRSKSALSRHLRLSDHVMRLFQGKCL